MLEVLEKLKEYFEKREDVIMAFLFGSFAKGQSGIESDIDIAVYFKPNGNLLEWENNHSYYEGEMVIWSALEKILKREVDFLVLNRVSSSVADSALKGIPILIKDRSLYIDFLLRITSEAIDFREWVEEFWSLKERRRINVTRR